MKESNIKDKAINIGYRWLFKILGIALCIVYGVILTGLVELSIRGDIQGVMDFFETKSIPALLNIAIVLAVVGVFYAISNRVSVAMICSLILFGLVGFVNISKMKFHDVPFLPWDLFLFRDALRVVPALSTEGLDAVSRLFLEIAGGMLFIGILAYLLIDRRQKGKRDFVDYLLNFLILALCLTFLWGISFENQYRATYFRENNVINYFWNQKDNAVINGETLTFTMNLSNIILQKPSNYSLETMENLYKKMDSYSVKGKEKPDIVVIMSESFSDPTKIKGLEFSSDPIPRFREIGKEGITGDLYVPVMGGKTANTEFEFLTGYSARILPEGSVPYQQHIKNDIRSLPGFLKGDNYYTTAIHNNIPEFWNREKVYRHMGFDRFISIKDFKDPTIYGSWMSDQDLTNKVIETLEEKKDKENNFIFAVTVQNHAPYDAPPKSDPIQVKGDLSKEDMNLMTRYVNGINVSDDELYRLVEYLKKREKPTVLCFFGDHLPGGFEMYRTLKYYTDMKASTSRKDMFATPYIIWSNYESKPETRDLGANALAALMMTYAQGDVPPISNYNLSQYDGKNNEEVYYSLKNLSEPIDTYRKNQYLIMYDDLFGKKYYNR